MKNVIISIVYAVLGFVGFTVVLFYSSPAVTPLFTVLGAIGFTSLFTHGIWNALEAYFKREADFQVNN